MSLLKRAKLAALGAAKGSGVSNRLLDSPWRSSRLLVLAYHGVSLADEHEWNPELYLPPQLLRERFMMLRDGGYTVVPLAEGVERLQSGTLPRRAVALTFDDGTCDFASRAVPILREFGFPATVYLATYYSERGGPVFDTASRYLLWKGSGTEISGDGLTLHGRTLDLRTAEGVTSASLDVHAFAREHELSADVKDDLLRCLAARVKSSIDALLDQRLFHLMRPDEVAALPGDLVDVQLHTHRHRVPLDRELFLREIAENRESIARMRGGKPAAHFCYPSGVTNPLFLNWLREAQVRSATTCYNGLAARDSDALMLPRLVDTANLTPLEFEGWLTGVLSFLPRRRQSSSMH